MKVYLYADGGSRGNPGVAGSGAVLSDAETKHQLASIVYAFDQPTSNNIAEYRGLIEGLRAAQTVGADEVYVFMDSKLVVEQMSGRWKIKHPDMKRLALQARELAADFDRVTFTWIPRAQNKEADALSNVAMDASAAGAPEGIVAAKSRLPQPAPVDDPEAEPTTETTVAPQPAEPTPTTPPWHGSGVAADRTRLVLVRHGETAMTQDGQYAGHRDVELTETGQAQAQAAADYVADHHDIVAIYASPLRRCQQTAQALAAATGATVATTAELIECDFGNYEGHTYQELARTDPLGQECWLADPTMPPPGGESLAQVADRVAPAIADIVAAHPGHTVAIVSHVNPIKAVLTQVLGTGARGFRCLYIGVGSVSTVEIAATEATSGSHVRGINEFVPRVAHGVS